MKSKTEIGDYQSDTISYKLAQILANGIIANPFGRLSLFHIWSKSCPACYANMPHLQKLRDTYAEKGLQVIAVHRPMGEFDLDEETVRKVATELGIREPCLLDNDHKIGDALGVSALPTYFLFDEQGRLRRHAKGNFGVRMIEPVLIRMYGETKEST